MTSSACIGTMALRGKVTDKKCDDIENLHEIYLVRFLVVYSHGGNQIEIRCIT